MPAFVGVVKLNSISSSGVFHIGDVFAISPQSVAKTFAGAGSFNTGMVCIFTTIIAIQIPMTRMSPMKMW